MKKTLALVLLWVLLLSMGIQVAFAAAVEVPNQSHIVLESIGDPETVDPAWAYDTSSGGLIFHVYETLIDFDVESVENFVSELAVDWVISPDGLTYTFEIRGTSGTHTLENIPPGNYGGAGSPKDSTWHDISASHYYSTNWVLRGWTDTDASGDLSVSDQIALFRISPLCGNRVTQYFHVDYVDPDGTVPYTITISEKRVRFQDLTELTTEDVEYSFEHILVQDRSGGPEWMFFEPLFGVYHNQHLGDLTNATEAAMVGHMLDDAVQRNDTHVWFNLYMSYPPFMQILSQSWASILNKDFCIAHGDWPGWIDYEQWVNYDDPATAPLDVAGFVMCGTGPYKLDYWTHGVEWSIVRFNDYWQGWPAPSCSRYTERITEKVVYEWGTRLADFRAGTADGVYVPRAYIAQVEGWPGIRGMKDLPSLTCGAIFFNFNITQPSPYVGTGTWGTGIPPEFFGDKDIRLAFTYAFDHATFINDVFLNEAETPPTPHIKGLAYSAAVWDGVTNPTYGYLAPVPIRDIDLAKIAEHMKLAFGGTLESPGPAWTSGFTMTIAYNAGNVPRMTAALMFKENVEAAVPNAHIDTTAITWSTYLGELWYYPTYRSVLPIFIIGWLADYPDPHNFVMPFQHSDGDFAYPASYNNPTVDALIEEGIAESDPVEREYIYWQVAWSYYNDQPSIALYQPLARRWERDWVQGYYRNIIFPMVYYHHIWKGLNGDIDGDNSVGIGDTATVSAHWSSPVGPLGYDRIADIWPQLQYRGDLAASAYLPQDEYGVPFLSIGEVDVFDWAEVNANWGDYKIP